MLPLPLSNTSYGCSWNWLHPKMIGICMETASKHDVLPQLWHRFFNCISLKKRRLTAGNDNKRGQQHGKRVSSFCCENVFGCTPLFDHSFSSVQTWLPFPHVQSIGARAAGWHRNASIVGPSTYRGISENTLLGEGFAGSKAHDARGIPSQRLWCPCRLCHPKSWKRHKSTVIIHNRNVTPVSEVNVLHH